MLDLVTEQYIAIGVAAGLWLFVYTPLLIYHGRRYYHNRHHVYVVQIHHVFGSSNEFNPNVVYIELDMLT